VELRERWTSPLAAAKTKLQDSINRQKCLQYLFFSQWSALKQHCDWLGIEIIGDIPIYVSYDSADVWANPEIFKLNRYKDPEFVSGVPPDLFSKTGQLWGNPVYNWLALKRTNYSWWYARLRHNLAMFNCVRLDHFRGFFHYWRVPAGDKTAKNGKWMKGPGPEFFDMVFRRYPKKSIIAEDLGIITPDIKSYIERSELAGMRVLQFGFGGNPKTNGHFPKNHIENSVCYTGTHDNNTAVGWFTKEANKQQKKRLLECLGNKPKESEIHWEMIRLAMGSAANLTIIPVQDVLGLGTEGRMNHPAKTKGNWQWRMRPGELTAQVAKKLANLTATYGR
jgi:4-alpha-glucanotransferase